jgi:hypothetical protein
LWCRNRFDGFGGGITMTYANAGLDVGRLAESGKTFAAFDQERAAIP